MSLPRRAGRRYRLMLYTRMLDRWWPALLLIGLGTVALAWPFYNDPYTRLAEAWRWQVLAVVGCLVIGASTLMVFLRGSAYVRPYSDHLRLVTPLLRLSVSYRRIQRIRTAAMSSLFPPRTLRGLRRDILQPLLDQTAVVLDLNALPLPMSTLKLFLSPFFFKDHAPHLVILVRDWMGLSTELDSFRAGTAMPEPVRPRSPASVLTRLPQKK